MILVFFNGNVIAGATTSAINPAISRASTAAAESINEVNWAIQVDS